MHELIEARRRQAEADMAAEKAARAIEATPAWKAYLEACGRAQEERAHVAALEAAIKATPAHECPRCHGSGGYEVRDFSPYGEWIRCPRCNGMGVVYDYVDDDAIPFGED